MAVRVNMNTPAVAREIMRRGGYVDRNVRARSQRVERRAKDIVRPMSRSGALYRSIHAERNRHPNGKFDFGYSIVADADHAGYVHDGTRAHIVRIQSRRVLSDEFRNTFGKFARIPAIPARPFLVEALQAALRDG